MIGMWKAFEEMEALGWLASKKRPRMVVVQADGCAPIPKAWEEHKATSEAWANASTLAAGLRVPKAYGDYILLDILKKSNGAAVAVSDDEIMQAVMEWARYDGVFAAPEGAAALVAYRKLLERGFFERGQKVVIFNTGSGLKYIDVVADYLKKAEARDGKREQPRGERAIGGIIQPY
jgi:threonine synthase